MAAIWRAWASMIVARSKRVRRVSWLTESVSPAARPELRLAASGRSISTAPAPARRLGQLGHRAGQDRRDFAELAAVERMDRLEIAQQARLDRVAQAHRVGLGEDPRGLVVAAEVGQLQRPVDGRLVALLGERGGVGGRVLIEQVGAEEFLGLGVFAGVVAAIALADQLLAAEPRRAPRASEPEPPVVTTRACPARRGSRPGWRAPAAARRRTRRRLRRCGSSRRG